MHSWICPHPRRKPAVAHVSCLHIWRKIANLGRRQLRSLDIDTLYLAQRTNTRLGGRSSFAAAGPRLLNSLPTQLRESDITLRQFRRALKTHLFGHWQLQRRVTVFFLRCVQTRLLTYLLNSDFREKRRESRVGGNMWCIATWGLPSSHQSC